MKKMLSLLALLVTALTVQAQDIEYVINGTAGQDVKQLYVLKSTDMRHADSVAVTGGKFSVKGKAPRQTFITLMDKGHRLTLVNDGTPLTVQMDSYGVEGSAENKSFAAFQSKMAERFDATTPYTTEYIKLRGDTTKAARERLKVIEQQVDSIYNKVFQAVLVYAQSNKSQAAPAFLLSQYYNVFDVNELKGVLDKAAAYYSHPLMKRVISYYESLLKRQPGRQFSELVMNDPDGKEVRLSQWVGKGNYTLVDFWASWCGPCRREMPNVVAAYKKYHAQKGFEIVGVSFDQKADNWKKAIRQLGMEWPQMSDLKGWGCAAHDVYGVNAIPSNILVDPEGKIIASDLRGEDLQTKLKEIYGF